MNATQPQRNSARWTAAISIAVGLLAACKQSSPFQAPWHLVGCSPADDARALDLHSSRSSSRRLPHPFPRQDAEVVADFAVQFRAIWRNKSRASIRTAEADLLGRLSRPGGATFRVLRVAPWEASRCDRLLGSTNLLFVVRVFDEAGAEVARAVLHESESSRRSASRDPSAVRSSWSMAIGCSTHRQWNQRFARVASTPATVNWSASRARPHPARPTCPASPAAYAATSRSFEELTSCGCVSTAGRRRETWFAAEPQAKA